MALSIDLRKRILESYENKEGSIKVLSKRYKVAISTIWLVIKKYRETGKIEAISPTGRKPKLGMNKLKLLEKLIERKPDATLIELGEALAEKTGIKAGTSVLDRACKKLGFRYKKNAICGGTRTP